MRKRVVDHETAHRLHMLLPVQLKERLDRACEEAGMTASDYVRQLIRADTDRSKKRVR
jgi:predicted DNA-binding protein